MSQNNEIVFMSQSENVFLKLSPRFNLILLILFFQWKRRKEKKRSKEKFFVTTAVTNESKCSKNQFRIQ